MRLARQLAGMYVLACPGSLGGTPKLRFWTRGWGPREAGNCTQSGGFVAEPPSYGLNLPCGHPAGHQDAELDWGPEGR